jgi:PncC family amidohydrolase
MPFLTEEQRNLAREIAAMLTEREQTVATAEGTTGGLVSAALLSVAGASRYFAGGGITYSLNSRVVLVGIDREVYANYRGTTPELINHLAAAMQARLSATWALAESGTAGPTGGRFGAPLGRTTVGVVGPVSRTEVFETGSDDREANMVAFTTIALRFLRDAIAEAGA